MGCCGNHGGGQRGNKGLSLLSWLFLIVAISMILYIKLA